MTRIIFLVSALIAAATCAAARDVTVRSGEHDGYTRLVVQVPPDTGWVLTHKKNGARLNVALNDVTYETGSVFARLSGNRLTSVSQAGGALELEFGCNCVASAFLFQKTMIVIDIAPGAVLPPLTSDIPPPVLPNDRDTTELSVSPDAWESLALPLLNLNHREFEDQLSTRLVQGADRGIVDLNLAKVGPRQSREVHDIPMPSEFGLNVQVSSVLDDLHGLLGPDIPQIETRPACISTAEIGFDIWSDTHPFPEQVAGLRTGLFQEFDRIDNERVVKLAKLYAYFGFGAEAIRMLDLQETQSPETHRIMAIARVIDGHQTTASNPFRGLQRCDGDAALWAALTEGELAPDARLEAIEQAFARLPDHLRRHIGPTLSTILVDAQRMEAARRVLRAVERIETQDRPSVAQAKAEVAKAEGDGDQSEALLTEVIMAPDAAQEAPLALARLVEKRWVDRGAVTPRELDLAAAYAVEFRRSEIGPMMMQTHAIALSLSQEFDRAMDLAHALPDNAGAVNRVLHVLAERSDDVMFLSHALNLTDDTVKILETDTAIALSARLAALGFAAPAHILANRPQDKIRRSERARLRARAALLNNRPHQAMLEIADDTFDEAVALRIQAMKATGDFPTTGNLLRDLGDVSEANRYFWLAGQPEQVDAAHTGKFGALTKTTLDLSVPPSRQPDKPLADAANLLQDSTETRRRITELFDTLDQD